MVAAQHRISTGSDFSRTLKKGVRVSTRDLLVTVAVPPQQWPDPDGIRVDVADVGGPRLGLIVSKAVGNAVTRHRVARRLRAAFGEVMADLPSDESMMVVRARASAADIGGRELTEQLRTALAHKRVRRLVPGSTPASTPSSTPDPMVRR